MKQRSLQIIRKCLQTAGMVIVALFIIFEEWGWEPLKKLLFWLFHWPLWQKLSNTIATLPPYGALACFSIPLIMDEFLKIIGLLQIMQGHSIRGTIIIIFAKIAGTALLAWIYQITEQQLLEIPWFARFHAWWIPWKNKLIIKVKTSSPWLRASALARQCKTQLRTITQRIKAWWQRHIHPK